MNRDVRSLVSISVAAMVVGPAAIGSGSAAAPAPIVTVVRHGGLCATGSECRSVLRITDTRISGDGYAARRLTPTSRTALLHVRPARVEAARLANRLLATLRPRA
jgi:hypothetical protein